MSAPRDPWQGMRRLFRLALGRRTLEEDVDQELRFHLEERVEELVAQGTSRADAEREVRARFGDITRIGAEIRRLDSGALARRQRVEAAAALARDFRLGVRSLLRHPGFAAAVILTLGLGMGATAAMFTVVQKVVLDPLPYPDPERLVRLKNLVPGVAEGEEWNLSHAQYVHFREWGPELEALGLYSRIGSTLVRGGEPLRVNSALLTPGMMGLLGARAARGRVFEERDGVPGAPRVALVTHRFWRSALAGDPAIVGKPLHLDGNPVEVVGVLAPGVELPPEQGQAAPLLTDVWLAYRVNPAGPFYNEHTRPAIARLKPGVTPAALEERLRGLLPELPPRFPNAYSQAFFDRYGFRTVAHPLKAYALGSAGRNLWILLAAVGLVLLIASANVVNLFLARLEARRRELELRAALGARRAHLAREAFAEGLVLVTGGAVVAALVAALGTRWLVSLSPPGIPRLEELQLDWRGLGFTLLLALLIAAVLAALPALRRAGTGLTTLGDGARSTTGPRRQRVRGALVVSQVALALMLVVGSALLLRSYARLRAVDPGIDPSGVLTVEWYPAYRHYDGHAKMWQVHHEVLGRIRALPGVAAAGAGTALPLTGDYGCTVQGFEEPAVFARLKEAGLTTCAGQVTATPGYLETLGIPLLAGRFLTDEDHFAPERGAVVVSKAFADRFWPGENPLGKRVAPNGQSEPPFYQVVGVAGDVPAGGVEEPPVVAIYYPAAGLPGSRKFFDAARYLVVRTRHGDPLDLLPAIRRAIAEADPEIPLANAETMEGVLARSMGRLSFSMLLVGLAGAAALALAAIGLYGLISYMVARRTSEIGVRIALGADPMRVRRFVVGGALRLAASGLVLGVIGATLAARVLGSLLYGVAPLDPVSYAAAVLVLASVAGLAGWIPARRAARMDPTQALRSE